MKKLIAILLSALLALSLFGCSPSGYELTERDGNYYITINAQNQYDDPSLNESEAVPHVTFSSLAEMKNDIKTGNFTEKEIYNIQRFEKNDNGEIQICNIDKLYEPVRPSGWLITGVVWYGTNYQVTYTSDNNGSGLFQRASKEGLDKAAYDMFNYEQEFLDPALVVKTVNNDNAMVTYEYTAQDEKSAMYVFHHIVTGNKEMIVCESIYSDESNLKSHYVKICGREDDTYFYFKFNNIKNPLTLDQLSQFGIREYVETVTE